MLDEESYKIAADAGIYHYIVSFRNDLREVKFVTGIKFSLAKFLESQQISVCLQYSVSLTRRDYTAARNYIRDAFSEVAGEHSLCPIENSVKDDGKRICMTFAANDWTYSRWRNLI